MEYIRQIHPKDNVGVALQTIPKGTKISEGVIAQEEIPAGHKIALFSIRKNESIVKYGYPIGIATTEIPVGAWVHLHNIETRLGELLEYTYKPDFQEVKPQNPKHFLGYRRKNGKVGIRNEVWIIPTVGCVNGVAKRIEEESQKFLTESLDGIYSYCHPLGCGQAAGDLKYLQRALAGMADNPNAGAVLFLALGCEHNQRAEMEAALGDYDHDRIKFLVAQECEDEIAAGVDAVRELCEYASKFHREECPASDLVVGLKCGGSDGLSGITANPLVGAFTDLLISQGGTAILTEVPEMFGAETILMNRCRDKEVFNKTVDMINGFKKYFQRYQEPIYLNPSPGNKAGGITTLEDKSLGCIQKGGSAPVSDVIYYGEQVRKKGLNLLKGPGYDLVSSAAEAFSGAQMVLFTTGRGTPFGCPVPTIKISSNTALAQKKARWIDFDAGRLLDGYSMPELLEEFYDFILDVASGKRKAKSEFLDKRDLAIFKDGVIL